MLQWNQLSQTLGTKGDNFVSCPAEALSWEVRRWRILEELIRQIQTNNNTDNNKQ